VVTHDVPAYALIVGVPAKQIGWMSEHGERLDLPVPQGADATLPRQRIQCPKTGHTYQLQNGRVTRLPNP
jgi:UDP-2-acetamido-3-amino-2,3-dideoxy-glucuronate N-acetyltransferase